MNIRCLALCVASLTAAWGLAQEIGYIEDFSLAPNREEALKKLVPGTDDYFYYHALHAQNSGQRDLFQKMLESWIRARDGNIAPLAQELRNRQLLLDYQQDPKRVFEELRRRLGLNYPYSRKTGEQRSDAPTKLDGNSIAVATLIAQALARDPEGSLDSIEEAGLELLADQPLSPQRRRALLARLQRPDYPGLTRLVLDDLAFRDSGGFGSLPIHARLTLAQLDELLAKQPMLRNSSGFVSAYLSKLAPEDEIDLETDAAAREAYFARVWEFVKTLDPVHNSLKANVLYGWLRHDQKQGVYNQERLLEYLKLPRNVWYLRDGIREQLPRGDYLAQPDRQFGLLQLPPIGNEEPLVRDCLLHFLAGAADFDLYKPWVRDDFLRRVFAEAKITNGVGDPQQWVPLLSPEEYRQLKERIDIDFAATNPDRFGQEDAVKLAAWVKNVPALIVKVYEINTLNYYRETGQPLNLAISLDGLVASSEQRFEYKEGSERRVLRTFEFPQLKSRGAYVIELIGNGKSSRALVQKGRLGVLQEVTAAGHAFTVLDEKNQPLADARAWCGGREFLPDAKGRLVVPFSTAPKTETLVVSQGDFAAPVQFSHQAETYALRSGIYVDREALLRGEKATLVLRPILTVNGRPASLKLLEEPRLTVRMTDLQGIATEKEIPVSGLRDDAEFEQELAVPEGVASVEVAFAAKVQNISGNLKQELRQGERFELNGIDRGGAVQDLHVTRTPAGYVVELRGKNGERRPGEPLACTMKHRGFREEIHRTLKTDEKGRAWLGDLSGLEWFRVQEPMGRNRTWQPLRDACTFPAALHGTPEETLRLPAAFGAADPLKDLSLLEVRRGQFVKDCSGALALKDGFVELKGLPAGDYSLQIKSQRREIPVRITAGERRDQFVLSARRALECPRLAPLQVSGVAAGADTVEIQLANATPFTRVHVVASRYLPEYDLFDKLGGTQAPGLARQGWRPVRSFYESGRDIGDEYRYILDRQLARKFPGNMLDRPGLLLNPWALRDTSVQQEQLAGGGAYHGADGGMDATVAFAPGMGAAACPGEAEMAGGDSASLDFLRQPAVTLWNLAADKEGKIRIPRAELKGLPCVRILATDPLSSVLKVATLDESPLETRELRQIAGLDPAKTFSEQKLVDAIPEKGTLAIADAATSRFETCDSVAKAYRLLATLNQDATFGEFSFVANWPALDAKEKHKLYSKYACHELNFFLCHKDPEFFKSEILPTLKNKKDKTFLDHWLLGDDLQGYLEPWHFDRLNAVERILLGRRLQEQAASLARDAKERAAILPPDIEGFNHRFDTALQLGAMEANGGEVQNALEDLKKQSEESGRKELSKSGLMFDGHVESLENRPPPPPMAAPASAAAGGQRFGLKLAKKAGPGDDRERAKRDLAKDKSELDANAEMAAGEFQADEKMARGTAARRFFQKLDMTKEWAENNYYHLPIEQQLGDLVKVNAFWADYAAADGKGPFLSKNFPQATGSFTEMMLALAVLDLPFTAAKHNEKVEGRSYSLTAGSPLVVFHREIREAAGPVQAGPVLLAQNFFRADDRYQQDDAADGGGQSDKYVADEFLPHVVYGAQVVLTNPADKPQRLQLLLQIPAGAVPVNGGFYTRGAHVAVEPHGTSKVEYYFYFPEAGTFKHYPATLAKNDQVVAKAAPFTFNVVPKLSKVDKTNWAWISQNGTPEETLAFLDTANLFRISLEEIAWRMQDKAFFQQTVAKLEARHVYNDTLWSYGLLHQDAAATRTYLRHSPFADQCGLWLASPLLELEPVERLDYQHLEYLPLVNARAHQVGEKRKILNDRFRGQYQRLMSVLSYKPALSDEDELAVAYYLMLQDRTAEAIDWYGRVDRKAVPEQLQCDYLDLYLALSQGDTARARGIAQKHLQEPVDRWRTRFEQALAQLDEIEKGTAAAAADPENRDQAQGALAATEPALELQVEAGKIRIDYRNLKGCTVNFYPMDIELLFSRNPFLQDGAAQFSYIRPTLSRPLELAPGQETATLDLPAEFRAKNVMVEVLGAGIRKTQAYYANTLKVQMVEAYGQLVVTHAETRKPLPGTYVKVYARQPGGQVKFVKDGYTDLRGRFDYASVNTSEVDNAERLSMLILSDQFGAVVREANPPKR